MKSAAECEAGILKERDDLVSARLGLLHENERLRLDLAAKEAELAVAKAQVEELRGWVERWKVAAREVGFAPEGSHPDEQKPRAETWHGERLNWIAEVNQLRAQVDGLNALLRRQSTVMEIGTVPEGDARDKLLAQVAELAKAWEAAAKAQRDSDTSAVWKKSKIAADYVRTNPLVQPPIRALKTAQPEGK
jgi:hypothetical protein